MWLWVTLGWGAIALAAAALHRRFRRVTGMHDSEVAGFVLRFETELATKHPGVRFLGMLPDRFACLLGVEGQETAVGLHEAYRHSRAFPDAFSRMVDQLLTDVREVGLDRVSEVDFASAAPCLLPQVRSRAWLDAKGCFGDSGLAFSPINEELVAVYVIDDASSMVFVCRAHLKRWQKSIADLHNLALGNLARLGKGVVRDAVHDDQPARFQSGDGFDAARVLLLGEGDGLLVAIPDRDTLWVGPEAGQNLEQLMATTEAIAEAAAHPVSPSVYRLTGGRLEPVQARR